MLFVIIVCLGESEKNMVAKLEKNKRKIQVLLSLLAIVEEFISSITHSEPRHIIIGICTEIRI